MGNAKSPEPERHSGANESSTSLDKALSVLFAFDSPLPSRGVTDLARELNLPKSTVHRILATYVRAGLLVKLPNGRYQTGIRLFELGSIFYRQTQLRSHAMPYLHELFHRTRLTVFLSVLDGDEILHLDHLPAPNADRITMTIGKRWALHTSSAGKLFLAYSSDHYVTNYIRRGLRPLTPFSITAPNALRQELEQIRRRGYSTALEEGVLGVSGLSAGIFNRKDELLAAVAIAGLGDSVLKWDEAVLSTADSISAHLPHSARKR